MAMAMDITIYKTRGKYNKDVCTTYIVRMTSEKVAFSSFKIILKGKAKI